MELASLLSELARNAVAADQSTDWPQQQMTALRADGVMGWTIPREYGGSDISEAELIEGYCQIAQACLLSAFILTQRNAACQRLVASENQELKALLLPALASGESFATVGISHLTTSRQHLGAPSVTLKREQGAIRINGFIPWVTGADQAEHVVTGGVFEDGRQALVALPRRIDGVTVHSPAPLMALTASRTASMELQDVVIGQEFLIAGPVLEVMKLSGGGTGSVSTSALALGVAARATAMMIEESQRRGDVQRVAMSFQKELADANAAMVNTVDGRPDAPPPTDMRHLANSLALRSSQAALAISKGAGYVRGHPAELAVREAMFFLVWSCPQPVVQGVLEELACRDPF